jgi:hypothetical protein
MSGAAFKGWGFMRFWETRRNHNTGATHHQLIGQDGEGDGDDELFHGRAIVPTFTDNRTVLGASPLEMRLEHAKRR